MVSEKCLEQTKMLFLDFGILEYDIPDDIDTDNELRRWRLAYIKKYLDDYENRSKKH